MKRSLEGQVAVITGASSGIGRALAHELAAHGVRVALVARRSADLEALSAEIAAAGGQSLAITADVTVPADLEKAVASVLGAWQHVDIVVANAGIYIQARTVEMTLQDLERSMAVNFLGAAGTAFAFLPAMRARGGGLLVFMSSQDTMIPIPPDGPYVASKSALTGLAQVMRQELRAEGIGVLVVHPGRIDTPLIDHLRMPAICPKVRPDRLARQVVRSIQHGRRRLVYPATGFLYILRDLWPAFGDWLIGALRLCGWPADEPQPRA